MTSGSGDKAADGIRISDGDRQTVIDRLREHTAAGRLTLEEFDDRVGEVMASRTLADLRRTLRELPAPLPVLATEKAIARQTRRRRTAARFRNFLGVNSICIGIWAVTGANFSRGGFWPEWVLLFTGLGLFRTVVRNDPTDDEKKAAHRHAKAARHGGLPDPARAEPAYRTPPSSRVLATVLYTDLVDSTPQLAAMGDQRWRAVLDQYDAVVTGSLDRTGGQLVKSLGDGTLARFDAPASALRCAVAIRDATHQLGFEVRAGVHTGEVEIRGDDVSGIAVHIGQRVCAAATPSEVWVTRTVVDLVAGADIHFDKIGRAHV